jgi:hypothetical protein
LFCQSTFTRSLSQKIRAEKLARKRKSADYVKSVDTRKEKKPKKFRSSHTKSTPSKLQSEQDYENQIIEIKKECEETQQ